MSRAPQSELPPEEIFDDDVVENIHDLEIETQNIDAEPALVSRGVEAIKAAWKTLPNDAGVYRMFGVSGEVLYVGKAKNLKKRVASYTRSTGHSNRIARMISETQSMEFVTTGTETEALLLESNYIKQLRPRYNVLMRDDKSFPYIMITKGHDAPQLTKHRGARNRLGDYFGPFANVGAVARTINTLQRAFLLRSCTDSYYENRSRPCLLYQIKRCAGPCTGEISKDEYKGLVGDAKAFLSGKSQAVKHSLQKHMHEAAEALEFEQAGRFRDRLATLSAIQSSQDINPRMVEEADVFAINEQAGQFCIQIFFFRTYQNWGNRSYFPKADKSLTCAEVLDSFVAQFYMDKPAAKLILVSEKIENAELIENILNTRSEFRHEIQYPQRGEKKDLIDHALKNAREALSRRLTETASQEKLLAALGEAFGLAKAPRRIDVFDNSHISGTNAVGGMIVAGPLGFMKTHYRTFNIKSTDITPGDDYGMMREVLGRRFARLEKEGARGDVVEADTLPNWPDLVLIDGGKGQLEAARKVLDELGITDVPLVGIAKGVDRNAGRETFFMVNKPSFKLPPRDPALYFVQRLRDEVHRFAIGAHRAKRKRELTKNPLDEIAGIGPTRKRALLLHFGTAKAVSQASLDDLAKTSGINSATAKLVYDFFNEK